MFLQLPCFSFRFEGLPLSIILDDSDPARLWPSVFDVRLPSSFEVLQPSQGCGELRSGAEIGVGRVDVVASVAVADRGTDMSGVEAAVKRPTVGVPVSNLPDREVSVGGVLPDRSWVLECLDCSLGAGALVGGITRGASLRGEDDRGFVVGSSKASSMALVKSLVFTFFLSISSIGPTSMVLSSGALEDRSCRAGRPGIVAITWSASSVETFSDVHTRVH